MREKKSFPIIFLKLSGNVLVLCNFKSTVQLSKASTHYLKVENWGTVQSSTHTVLPLSFLDVRCLLLVLHTLV